MARFLRRWKSRKATATLPDDEVSPSLGADGAEFPPDLYPATFKDSGMEREFLSEGFVVVDFIDAPAVSRLREVCERFHPEPAATWESDFYSSDQEAKSTIFNEIGSAFVDPIDRLMVGHRSILRSFVLNWPGPDGGLPLHQHSSVVDERHFRSPFIWCPLVDATEANGTLHVVARSHRFQVHPRPERTPGWFEAHMELLLDRYLTSVPVNAGQALIFDNQLLHVSFLNTGDECRMAAGSAVTPIAATPHYYYPLDDRMATRYELDPEHFLRNTSPFWHMAEPAGLRPIEDIHWVTPAVSLENLEAVLEPGTCSHVRWEQSVDGASSTSSEAVTSTS